MYCVGGTNHGVNRPGHPFELQVLRVFHLDAEKQSIFSQPPEVYHRTSIPNGPDYWRHESLDTPEKVAAALEDFYRLNAAKTRPRWMEAFRRPAS